MRYCGRLFTEAEVDWIRELLATPRRAPQRDELPRGDAAHGKGGVLYPAAAEKPAALRLSEQVKRAEKSRFTGACYKAANWQYLGDTQGRGRHDRHALYGKPVKGVWIYPLVSDFSY